MNEPRDGRWEDLRKAIFSPARAARYPFSVERAIPGYSAMHDVVAHAAVEANVERLLVLGGGGGEEILRLARLEPHIDFTVVDPSESMLDLGRKRVAEAFHEDLSVRWQSSDHIIDPGSFDAVTLLLVLHFLPPEEKRTLLETAYRSTRQGGRLWLSDLIPSKEERADWSGTMIAWRTFAERQGASPAEIEFGAHHLTHDLHFWHVEEYQKCLASIGWRDASFKLLAPDLPLGLTLVLACRP